MTIKDLKITEYNSYYSSYVNLIPKDTELVEGFKTGSHKVIDFFQSIVPEKLDYAYAEKKWNIKEVFQHLIDTERVFQYRCFRFSRRDKTPISGFEQDNYIEPSQAKNKSIDDLIEEFKAVRQSFIVLLNSLSENDLKFVGYANGSKLSARAAAYIILGHEIHHIEVIKKLYLT